MAVQGGHLNVVLFEGRDDRIHLVRGKHEVAGCSDIAGIRRFKIDGLAHTSRGRDGLCTAVISKPDDRNFAITGFSSSSRRTKSPITIALSSAPRKAAHEPRASPGL